MTVAAAHASQAKSCLWIAWNAHRRTTGLCAAWDVPLHVIRSRRGGVARWLEQMVATLGLLRREKPHVLFVPNPSLALSTLAVLGRRLYKYYLVVDAHNEGIRPFHRRGALVRWMTRRVLNRADATIVSNAALADDVHGAGGRPLVLPDCLPEPPALRDAVAEAAPQVVVIATFWGDEPIAEIMAAAAAMPAVSFAFTGDTARFLRSGIEPPDNVRLTGFLPDAEYWHLLAAAAVVCDLTLKSDCLVCGAYEALAAGKSMVLSDNPPTRDIFGPAAVLTGSTAEEIASAIATAIASRERLEAAARDLRDAFRTSWPTQASAVWDAIQAGAAAADQEQH